MTSYIQTYPRSTSYWSCEGLYRPMSKETRSSSWTSVFCLQLCTTGEAAGSRTVGIGKEMRLAVDVTLNSGSLTPSLSWYHLKRPIKVQNFKPLNVSVFFSSFFLSPHCYVKGFSSKHIVLKADNYYRSETYTVCRRVCASFGTEMFKAGAVKGLMDRRVREFLQS